MDDKSVLKRDLFLCKSEIINLGEKLNEIAGKRLELQKNKNAITSNIHLVIDKVNLQSPEQKSLVDKIKKAVSDKEMFYKELNSKVSHLQELDDKLSELNKGHDLKLSPGDIQKNIMALEYKIQTEVIPFEKEKQINKHIKKLKSVLITARELEGLLSKSSALINEIRQIKNNINSSKESIISNKENLKRAKEDKARRLSEIAKFKDQRVFLNKGIDLANISFFEIDAQLKEKLLQFSSLSSKLQELISSEQNKKRALKEKITKEKQDLVLEKIKRGEKLTNEDLLAFQDN